MSWPPRCQSIDLTTNVPEGVEGGLGGMGRLSRDWVRAVARVLEEKVEGKIGSRTLCHRVQDRVESGGGVMAVRASDGGVDKGWGRHQ